MKTNIILIMTDDQTINTINAKGNSEVLTPNLDELCNEGVFFDNCLIHGGTSGAICMPSRAVLNSSQDLFKLKDAGNVIPDYDPLLAEELQKNGYQTYFTGKWHNGIEAFNRSFTNGDNIFFGGMWDHYNVPMNKFDPEGKYDNTVDFVANFLHSSTTLKMHANKFNPGIHSTDVITNSACDFLDKVDTRKPFYLNVAYLAPHDPRVVPNTYQELYKSRNVSLPLNFKHKHEFDFGQENERDEQLTPRPINVEWYKSELKSYYAMITHIDNELGKIIRKLKERNLYEESIIIFTSDNGLALGAHGLMGKQNLYNESINVPFIIKLPQKQKIENNDCHELITLQDVFPTILDLIDAEIPSSIGGKSFKQLILNSNTRVHREVYLSFTEYIRGIQTDTYKLIKYRPQKGVEFNQLFNIKEDKYECQNLYDNADYSEVKMELELKLLDLKEIYERYDNHFTKLFWSKYE